MLCKNVRISEAALICTRVLPVRESDIQWYTHTESVFTCSILHCHSRAKLMPFNTTSSLARLICWVSFSGHSQQASSSTVSSLCNATQIAKELALIHTFSSHLYGLDFLAAQSIESDIICCSKLSLVSSSQPFVIKLALL